VAAVRQDGSERDGAQVAEGCSCPPASGHIYATRIPTDGDGWKAAHLLANRFRRELMIALPTLVRDIPKVARHWTCLDVGMLERLEVCGGDVHVHHDAPVQHLGATKTSLAFVRQVISWVDYLGCVDSAAQADAAATEFLPNIEALWKIRGIPIPAESVESDPRLRLAALLASIENETQAAQIIEQTKRDQIANRCIAQERASP
jgi:hypothetical protein